MGIGLSIKEELRLQDILTDRGTDGRSDDWKDRVTPI